MGTGVRWILGVRWLAAALGFAAACCRGRGKNVIRARAGFFLKFAGASSRELIAAASCRTPKTPALIVTCYFREERLQLSPRNRVFEQNR